MASLPAETKASLVLVKVKKEFQYKNTRERLDYYPEPSFPDLRAPQNSKQQKDSETLKRAAAAPTGRHNKSMDVLICCMVSNVMRLSAACEVNEREERE